MAVSSITLGGPAGIAAAALAIGFFVLAMTTFYYELVYLVGKEILLVIMLKKGK